MHVPSAPKPGGTAGPAEESGAGDQCQTGRGHARSGGPHPEAEGFGRRGQAQVFGPGGTCPHATWVSYLSYYCSALSCEGLLLLP